MKKIILSLVVLAFISCTKDNGSSITPANLNSTVSSGTWKVTYYWDNDHEETTNFTGYSFTFGGSNVLTAVKSSTTVTGTWVTGTDDSKVKLTLAFVSPVDFIEISDDWEVIEKTTTKIRLQDVSGGISTTDYLTFEKN